MRSSQLEYKEDARISVVGWISPLSSQPLPTPPSSQPRPVTTAKDGHLTSATTTTRYLPFSFPPQGAPSRHSPFSRPGSSLEHRKPSHYPLTPPSSSPATPALHRGPFPDRHRNPDRKVFWPESPTLSTKRAKKQLQLASPFTPTRATDKRRSRVSPKSRTSNGIRNRKTMERADAQHSGKMLPPLGLSLRPRALTLDEFERLTLPPMVTTPSRIGPIRSSSSYPLSKSRHPGQERHNPYFPPTPARSSIVQSRSPLPLTPSPRREANDADFWTSTLPAPRARTSSVRSTATNEVFHQDLVSSTYSWSRTSYQLDSSPLSPRRTFSSPIQPDRGEHLALMGASYLSPPHDDLPNNALGLFMEPAPFPSALQSLNHGLSPQRAFLPGIEASGKVSAQHGSIQPHALVRSPATMSDHFPPTPSPSSEDSLPKLSLTHRHSLVARTLDLARSMAELSSHTPSPDHSPGFNRRSIPSTPSPRTWPIKREDKGDHIFHMPVLRAMSPLEDMSSDSDDEDVSELTLPSIRLERPASPSEAQQSGTPEEGSTGEIFLPSKSVLPLTIKEGRGSTQEQLRCKLHSTTHQCFSVVDGKWACYRRNYLKIDVTFHFVDSQDRRVDTVAQDLICHPSDRRTPFLVERFAIHISAHVINHEGRLQKGRTGIVPLIQFGPARERGPRDPVQPVELRSGGSVTKDANANENAAARLGNVAAFRRVQIRSATMNNGQRGSAGQQFYALKLTLLAYPKQGALTPAGGTEVASAVSHPITVRGRSKVHYAAPSPALKQESLSATPAASTSTKRRLGSTGRRHSNRGAGASEIREDGEHRRSTRLLRDLPVDTSSASTSQSHSRTTSTSDDTTTSMAQDADDEESSPGPVERRAPCRVMDIRSVM